MFSSFRDFLQWLRDNPYIKKVIWTITTTGQRLWIACEYFKDLVKAVVNFFIDTWRDVRDFFCKLWEDLKLKWKAFINYLGFLCNWEDIKTMKRVMKHKVEIGFECFNEIMGLIQSKVDDGFQYATDKVDELFGKLKGFLEDENSQKKMDDGSKSEMLTLINKSSTASSLQSKTDAAMENNQMSIVKDGSNRALLSNVNGLNSLFDKLKEAFEKFCADISSLEEFSNAVEKFKSITQQGSNPSLRILSGLVEVVKGIVKSMISFGKLLTTIILEIVVEVFSYIKYILFGMKISIPVVSKLYYAITGEVTMTMGDLFLLILAIPATLITKLTLGREYVMKTDMADRLIASFHRDDMLVMFGLKPKPTQNQSNSQFDDAEYVQMLKSHAIASTVFGSFALISCMLGDIQYCVISVGTVESKLTDLAKSVDGIEAGALCLLCDILAYMFTLDPLKLTKDQPLGFYLVPLIGGALPWIFDIWGVCDPYATPLCALLLGLGSGVVTVFCANMRNGSGELIFAEYDTFFKGLGSVFTGLRVFLAFSKVATPDMQAILGLFGSVMDLLVMATSIGNTAVFVSTLEDSKDKKVGPRLLIGRC